MKHSKKQLVILLMIVVFTLALLGCAKTDESAESSKEQAASSSAADSSLDNSQIVAYKAVSEAFYAIFKDDEPEKSKVYYRELGALNYTRVDSELIRKTQNSGEARVDVLGLRPKSYEVKIVTSNGAVNVIDELSVGAYDRSGYAHFKFSGVGAYNDDGTLKQGAKVIYVTDENKNTVTLGRFKGLGEIANNASSFTFPLCVRIIGSVKTRSWDEMTVIDRPKGTYFKDSYSKEDNTKSRDIALGITDIEGLADNVLREGTSNWDSYFNTLEIKNAKNITFEGIGDDAEIFQWGVTFKRCNSIEVRNLEFTDYPEDACAFGGKLGSEHLYGNYWVHNNVFNAGKNYWDLTWEQDKHHGDGAIDLYNCRNATYAYNHIRNCHKTGLAGGNDTHMQYNITFHHNYFESNSSRLPLARQANMHYYNNYFYGTTNFCMQAMANAYIVSEANYYDSCNKTMTIRDTGVIKSINDVFNASTNQNAVIVAGRNAKVANSNAVLNEKYETTNGQNFDTDAELFYYDNVNNKTLVSYMTSAEQAKVDCVKFAGVCKESPYSK